MTSLPARSFDQRDHKFAEGSADILVSVVVPARVNTTSLQRCLHALRRQSFDHAKFEVIVADDMPTAATRQIVIALAKIASLEGLAIHYIACRGVYGPAAARNCGWRAAAGKVLAFTDNDMVADIDWVANGYRALEGGADAAWGDIVVPEVTGDTDIAAPRCTGFVTANCFCSRRLMQRLGGFDERFRSAWRADSDLFFRMLGVHALVLPVPNAVVAHPNSPAWGASLRQQKKFLFDALLFKKHPMLYRKLIDGAPRRDYYLIVLLLLLATTSWWLNAVPTAAGAGAIWLMLTARLCHQRLRLVRWRPADLLEVMFTSALIPPLALFWRALGALRFRVRFF